jgi:hypothetical protein
MAKQIFTAPWYPWYVNEVLDSERVEQMSLAEEGAYRRAIDKAWKKGSIPADPEAAAKTIGKKCTVKIAEVVLKMFDPMPKNPSRMINKKLEQVRKTQEEIYNKKSGGGKLGMAKRWKQSSSVDNTLITEQYDPNNQEKRREDKRGEEQDTTPNGVATHGHAPLIRSQKKPNDEFLAALKVDPVYSHIDIDRELAKAKNWASPRNRQVTQRFFINWLNRIEKPLENGHGSNQKHSGSNTKPTTTDRLAEHGEVISQYPTEAELRRKP